MQNYIKTILSAFKTWTQKKIKESTADWNENDSSNSSYVKNRTHWEEKKLIYLVPEMTVTISEDGDYETLSESCPILTAGQAYTVVLNGVTYECIARQYDSGGLIGNGTIYGDGDAGNSEPFSCDSYDDGTIYLNAAIAGNYTISISTIEAITHKLDKKYLDLPTNLATTDDVELAKNAANDAKNAANAAQVTADTKMDATNPVGTGSFSMNRLGGSDVGKDSSTFGTQLIANTDSLMVNGRYNIAESNYMLQETTKTSNGNKSNAFGYKIESFKIDDSKGTFICINKSTMKTYATAELNALYFNDSFAGSNVTLPQRVYKPIEKTYNGLDTFGLESYTIKYIEYTIVQNNYTHAHIVGNGTSDTTRSNAHTLDWEGNAWYSGDVYVGSTSGTNRDEGSKKLATEDFVISQLENFSSLNRKIVEILPDISEADPNIIYMVPKSASLVSNVYDEYMFIEEAWELIGSTAVDLSDYVTKGELTNALDDYATKDELADKNSDWAQNDAEQPDYVENRTHYVQDTLDRYSAHFEDGFPEGIFWTISLTKEQAQGIYDSWETAVEWISPYGGLVSLSNLDTETIDNGRTKVVIIPDYQVELRISPEEKKLYSSSNQGGILLKSPVEQIKYLDAKYVEDMYSTKLIRDNTIYESSAYSDSSVSNYSYGYFEDRELAEILLKDFNGVKYYINGHECYYMGQPSSHLCQFYYVDECEVVFSVELKTNKVDREYVINGEIYITGTSVSDSAFEHLLNVQECKIYVAKEEKVNKIPKKYLPDECLLKEEFTLARLGVTATATELNYVDGVKSSIQSQLNNKMQSNNPVYSGIIVHQLSQNLEPGSDSVTFSVGGIASGPNAFAEGASTQAYGAASHSEGNHTIARGQASHAEGYRTKVKADSRGGHAEGIFTIATAPGQHAQGSANVEDEDQIYAHIIGNGSDEENRSNAYALDWQGNGWFAGDVYVGSTSGIDKDEGSKKLATEDLVAQKTQVQIITWGADD